MPHIDRPARGRKVAYLTVVSFGFLVVTLAMFLLVDEGHGVRREAAQGSLLPRSLREMLQRLRRTDHETTNDRLQPPSLDRGRARTAGFQPGASRQAIDQLRGQFPESEVVLLSTCNRVEIYTAAENPAPLQPRAGGAVHGRLPRPADLRDLRRPVREDGEDAVRHLFMVAASLDSMVVGEPQILSQVKQAYELAKDHSSAGPLTHGIFQAAVRLAKRVTTETSLHQRRVSIPSVAIGDFASQIFERFDDKQVLVIGAGEMGEETCATCRTKARTK